MRYIITVTFFGFILSQNLFAQQDSTQVDHKYREDQFYASITYNSLGNIPGDLSQSGFSTGFHFGFIRDMPINERRNLAIGVGLGLSSNSYNQNILIAKNDGDYTYSFVDETNIDVSKNKFTTYLVEVPFEFRWRTSTASNYNFWRIYPGFKLSYLMYNSTKFKSSAGDIKLFNVDDFNRLQYGVTLSAGYGTWNFQAYYALNPIFDDTAKLNNRSIDIIAVKIGIMFYIL